MEISLPQVCKITLWEKSQKVLQNDIGNCALSVCQRPGVDHIRYRSRAGGSTCRFSVNGMKCSCLLLPCALALLFLTADLYHKTWRLHFRMCSRSLLLKGPVASWQQWMQELWPSEFASVNNKNILQHNSQNQQSMWRGSYTWATVELSLLEHCAVWHISTD